MLQMLRTAATTLRSSASRRSVMPRGNPAHINFMLYRDAKPFMVINAPSLDHARLVIANFPADHAWMLVAQD